MHPGPVPQPSRSCLPMGSRAGLSTLVGPREAAQTPVLRAKAGSDGVYAALLTTMEASARSCEIIKLACCSPVGQILQSLESTTDASTNARSDPAGFRRRRDDPQVLSDGKEHATRQHRDLVERSTRSKFGVGITNRLHDVSYGYQAARKRSNAVICCVNGSTSRR
jgi:ribosome modulation factor